jgi:hypothetical protein
VEVESDRHQRQFDHQPVSSSSAAARAMRRHQRSSRGQKGAHRGASASAMMASTDQAHLEAGANHRLGPQHHHDQRGGGQQADAERLAPQRHRPSTSSAKQDRTVGTSAPVSSV